MLAIYDASLLFWNSSNLCNCIPVARGQNSRQLHRDTHLRMHIAQIRQRENRTEGGHAGVGRRKSSALREDRGPQDRSRQEVRTIGDVTEGE